MASASLVEGGGGGGAEENFRHHRFSGENKVYTRKSFNKSHKPRSSSRPPLPLSSSFSGVSAEDLYSSRPQPPPPPAVSSDASSSLNRPATPQPDDCLPPSSLVANGYDCRNVTFSLASLSRQELRDLQRKLASELEQVWALAKRLEAHELQLAGTAAANNVLPHADGYAMSQLSATDPYTSVACKRALEADTPTTAAPNPFSRQLSVSAATNNISVNESLDREKRMPKANQHYRNTDFVLGNEKLPPPDHHSHKKSKANGGKKQSMYWSEHFSAQPNEKKLYAQAFKNCGSLFTKLLKHRYAWVFDKPVDVKGLGLHDYCTIIKHPMDLGTIRSRLSKNWYKSPHEFAEDVRLTFRNAMTYNPEGQDVHIMAKEMLQIFDESWPAIEAELSYVSCAQLAERPPPLDMRVLELSDYTMLPTIVERKSKTVNHHLHVGRLPAPKKPKAKDLDKRDMTFEEKQKLSNNLQNLPPEKLELVVQIIKRRNLSLSQHDDEIEVDINTADVETLWELDRFVTNYKKSLSKHKRKAELAIQARQQAEKYAHKMAQARLQEAVIVEANEKVGGLNNGANAGESSSTSSSSSDSSSSSSDTDSDSSS